MDSIKSWLAPVLGVIVIGALLIGGISWFLLSKAPRQKAAVSSVETDSSASESLSGYQARPAERVQQQGQQDSNAQASQPPAPPSGQDGAPPPPPEAGGAPAGAAPGQGWRQRSGDPSAQAQPDSGSSNQAQNRRNFMKSRLESTAPEDRARMLQLRIEEMKYRAAHGGSGGGGGPRPGGPPPP